MEKYSEYKYSGVQWLGEIPRHWEVVPMKYCIRINNGRDYKDIETTTGIPVIGTGCVFAYASECMYEGEVVFFGRKGTINKPFHYIGKFWAVDTVFYATARKNMNCKFLYYVGTTIPFGLYSTSTAIPSMTQTDLLNNRITLPSLSEQDAMVEYLDKTTAKIDEAIRQQQRMIELLNERKQIIINNAVTKGLNPNVKMKDSGVEWIGEIPEHWKIMPIKSYKSSIKNAFVDGPFGSNLKSEHYVENGDVFVVESGFITTGKFVWKDMKTIKKSHFETISRSECKAGDIIIAKIGAKFGMAAELPVLSKPSVVSGNSLKLTLNNKKVRNQWQILLMALAKQKGGYIGLYQETAQPALSLSSLNNMQFPIPSIEEQDSILTILNTKIDTIEKAIDKATKLITLLQERKQIIINDVVTGKVKVS